MAYWTDVVEVGAGEPVSISTVGPTGIVVQVLDGAPVTVGPATVEAGKGLRLDVEDGWQTLPGGYAGATGIGLAPVPLELFGVTESGTAHVAYLRHDLPSS